MHEYTHIQVAITVSFMIYSNFRAGTTLGIVSPFVYHLFTSCMIIPFKIYSNFRAGTAYSIIIHVIYDLCISCMICSFMINPNFRAGATGWRRIIGHLKLQVIFRKRATNYRALLRTVTCKDKTFCGSSPPSTNSIEHL